MSCGFRKGAISRNASRQLGRFPFTRLAGTTGLLLLPLSPRPFELGLPVPLLGPPDFDGWTATLLSPRLFELGLPVPLLGPPSDFDGWTAAASRRGVFSDVAALLIINES